MALSIIYQYIKLSYIKTLACSYLVYNGVTDIHNVTNCFSLKLYLAKTTELYKKSRFSFNRNEKESAFCMY